jgi:hypothetical protein
MSQPPDSANRRPLYILGVTACIIAPALLLYAFLTQSEIRAYRQEGVPAEARVIELNRSLPFSFSRYFRPVTNYSLEVSYLTTSILNKGDVTFATIDELVSPSEWEALQAGDQVDILYLPDDPKNDVVLRSSLENPRPALAERYDFAVGVFVVGVIFIIGDRQLRIRNDTSHRRR